MIFDFSHFFLFSLFLYLRQETPIIDVCSLLKCHRQVQFFGFPAIPPLSTPFLSPNFLTLNLFGVCVSGGYGCGGVFGGVKGPFTPSQWMELEHQALIYKYITANVPIPSNLLIPIRKALDSAGLYGFSGGPLGPTSCKFFCSFS